MKQYSHFGHPHDRFTGPLQIGLHTWRDHNKEPTGITLVSEDGERVLASVPRTAEEAEERRRRFVQAEVERRIRERRARLKNIRIIEKYWNRPTH